MPPKVDKPPQNRSPQTTPVKPTDSWKETQLNILDVYNIHKSRTCDIFLMAESTETCTIALEKFAKAGKIDSTNVIKVVTYNDILINIQKFFLENNSKIPIEILYNFLAQEAMAHLNNGKNIPSSLLAKLIRVQIAYTINQDIAREQIKVKGEKDVEDEFAALVEAQTDTKGKKDAKPKPADKKDAKGKAGEKGYDVCDSHNELKFKTISKLIKKDANQLIVQDAIDIEQKHLFVIIIGFYDLSVTEELFKNGIKMIGIIELTNPPQELTNLSSQSCLCIESDITQSEDDEESNQSDISWKPYSIEETPTSKNERSDIIFRFWRKIYEYLEGDDECPEYLRDSFHMTVSLPEDAFEENTFNDNKHCLNILSKVGSEIVKSPDIKRQHVNYIRNLKICSVETKPLRVTSKYFKFYNNLMNEIPPDCINIFIIVYAIVEEVCKKVADPPQIVLETPPSCTFIGINKQSSKEDIDPKKDSGEVHQSIKGQIADVLYKSINIHSSINKQNTKTESFICNPKIDLQITNKVFLVQENNKVEIMINSYDKIKSKLLDINTKVLMQISPVFLWRRFPYDETIKQKVLNKTYNLQAMADYFELPIREMQYIIHLIFFNFLNCSHDENHNSDLCNLQTIFPKKHFITTPTILESNIPMKFNIEESEYIEENPEIEIPNVLYQDEPNLYEAKNIVAYKQYEILPFLLILQELYRAERTYLCLDYKYCSFDDSILLRYHNFVNEFGISIINWDQNLRTPVSTIRQFCRYVIHAESIWLKEEEEKYKENLRKKHKNIIQQEYKFKQNFYPDLIFTDEDFIQRGSMKWKLMEESKQQEEKPLAVDKKNEKDKDKGKGKDNKAPTNVAPSQIPLLEKLSKPTLLPKESKLSLRCAKENEPFSFYAYDISNDRVQLTGTTTIFNSQDGFKVTVDQTRFIGKPKNISINICINDNCLILHRNQVSILEPFAFHFALSDKSIIAFEKPIEIPPPEEKLGKKICETLRNNQNPEKRQDIYFVSKKQSSVLKCFNIPYITKKKLILSEDLIVPFLNQLNLRGINVKLTPSDTLSPMEIEKFNDAIHKSQIETKKTKSKEKIVEPKYFYDVILKVVKSIEDIQNNDEDLEELNEVFTKAHRALSGESIDAPPLLQRSNKKLLKKIKESTESHLPIFKICSSKLHKNQYVKRIKSRIEIPIGAVLKRIPYNPPLLKSKIDLNISKLLPVTSLAIPTKKVKNKSDYNIRICLPSGLLIQSMDGIEGFPFHIRQKYLDKGPQCKNIEHEHSRTFLRNGNILIKKLDGNIDILSIAGQRVKCEIPYIKIKSKIHKNDKEDDLIPLHTASLTRFQKHLNKSVKRLHKHLIDGCESRHLMSYRACQKWKKNYVKDPNQVYILQNSIGNLKKFSLITNDGKKLKITSSIITERKKYYITMMADYCRQEVYYRREDGTHSVLDHESTLTTQFPDGTRLTTWIEIEPEALLIKEDEEETVDENFKQQETQVNDFEFYDDIDFPESIEKEGEEEEEGDEESNEEEDNDEDEEGEEEIEEEKVEEEEISRNTLKFPIDDISWVSIHLNIKYEHPNYATIIYYGIDKRTEIILPNDVTLEATDKGEYAIKINQDIHSKVTREKILLESRLCGACRQKGVNILNISPFYSGAQINLHETELLRTTDSFKKIFIVSYTGQIFKNIKYLQRRSNMVDCKQHNCCENQKFFILTRNLIGCRLWDVESYKQQLIKAKKLKTSVHVTNSWVELRTFIRKPYHETFLIPYTQPVLVLSKNKPKSKQPKDLAYIIRQVINDLPQLRKFYNVFLILFEVLNTKCAIVSRCSMGDELKKFSRYIIDEILGKHIRPEEQTARKPPSPSLTPTIEKPPFHIRKQKWTKECHKYWTIIRENDVPQYFGSPHHHAIIGRIGAEELLCRCYGDTEDLNAPCECDKIELSSSNDSTAKNADTVDAHKEMEVQPVTTKSNKQESVNIHLPTSKKVKIAREPPLSHTISERMDNKLQSSIRSMPMCWITAPLGKQLLNKVRDDIIEIAVGMKFDDCNNISVEKISKTTRNLFHDLMMTVQNYEMHMCTSKDYIKCSIDAAIDNIMQMQLNPIELILMLDNAARLGEIHDINKKEKCIPVLHSFVTGDTMDLEDCHTEPTKPIQDVLPSYFGVYEHYKDVDDTLRNSEREKPCPCQESVEMVFKRENISKTNVVESNNSFVGVISKNSIKIEDDDQCKWCTIKEEPELITKLPSSEVECGLNEPAVKMNLSTVVSEVDGLARNSSSIPDDLELSPESSLLDFYLNANASQVDAIMNKDKYKECESKMVLFSEMSLKGRDLELLEPEPYIEKNPDVTINAIQKIVNTKTTSENIYKLPQKEDSQSLERERNKSLLSERSLYQCQKCILRIEDDILDKPESLLCFKTKSVASLLMSLKAAQSGKKLSSKDNENIITASRESLLKDLISSKPHLSKDETNKLINKITDSDRNVARDLQTSQDRTTVMIKKVPRSKAVRRTVGSQTQYNVQDQNI